MQEICYYLADDGKRFDDRYECIEYERRKALEAHKDEFQFYDFHKKPIPIGEVFTENVAYIVVKSENCIKAIGDWFKHDDCIDPFDKIDCESIGTWAYCETEDGWLKLELEIEKLQTIINEINQ